MKKVLRTTTAAALVIAALALFVGVAQSMIPSEDGTYWACYKKAGGALRIIDESTECRRDEVRISWNRQGQPGLPGEPGQPGEPGTPGEPGAPGLSYAGYTQMTLEDQSPITIPYTPPPTGQPVTVAELTLPEPPEGGGYLATATFELQNSGPGDAGLVCHVGNRMAFDFFVPVTQLSDPGGPGVYGDNHMLVTLTGLSDYGGLRLACGLNSYAEGAEVPAVQVIAYTLSATLIDQLDEQQVATG